MGMVERGAGVRRVLWGVAILALLGPAPALRAQADIGTWVRQSAADTLGVIGMTIETCCDGGRRMTLRMSGSEAPMIVEARFDGSDVPVLLEGGPTGETMAITRVDDHHTVTVLKMNGKPFGTSKAELSADGKTMTVTNEYTSTAGVSVGVQTEVWVRK